MATSAGVTFHFYWQTPGGAGRHEKCDGEVRRDGDRMILEVPWEGDDPYVIVGHPAAGGYETRYDRGLEDAAVIARWAMLGERGVGTWEEDGYQYVFTFVLAS